MGDTDFLNKKTNTSERLNGFVRHSESDQEKGRKRICRIQTRFRTYPAVSSASMRRRCLRRAVQLVVVVVVVGRLSGVTRLMRRRGGTGQAGRTALTDARRAARPTWLAAPARCSPASSHRRYGGQVRSRIWARSQAVWRTRAAAGILLLFGHTASMYE